MFVETPEMREGTAKHKAIEKRVAKGVVFDSTSELRGLEPLLAHFDATTNMVRVEYFTGMKRDGSGCTWDSRDCWFRGKADLVELAPPNAWLIDWKNNGKAWEDPFELQCQAMLIHANHPDILNFVGEYYWLKMRRPGKRYDGRDLAPYNAYEKLGTIGAEMLKYHDTENDIIMGRGNPGTAWPKRPGKLCAWCDVADCEHNDNMELRK